MSPDETVRAYHARTCHRFERYAAKPETLDWDAQPDPFRRFETCPQTALPLTADELDTPFAELGRTAPRPFDRKHLGILFELSFAISAWKEYAGDRWALRCNPSSGNLHPTESYAVPFGVEGVEEAIYHYRADRHALEQRSPIESPTEGQGVLVGLSSVHWREAWKYGERAFRYSQLDTGHAIAALAYAAASLGWHCTLLRDWSSTDIATLLGIDRTEDFADVEPESPETLLWVHTDQPPPQKDALLAAVRDGQWSGRANLLDPKPMYAWPVIDVVDRETAIPALPQPERRPERVPSPAATTSTERAAKIIRGRRSAQRFNPDFRLPKRDFFHMLDRLLPHPGQSPWQCDATPVHTHLILFVHRVDGLRPGLYALPRNPAFLEEMQATMRSEFLWEAVDGSLSNLPLYLLVQANARNAARKLSCHQNIASDSAFSAVMLGEFDRALTAGPWAYRHLFWEAGMIGQTLYLEAEAAGVRGTGIGCYFDPTVHKTLGIEDTRLQSMYHFTVGRPLTDPRLQTLPAYAHLGEREE